VATVRRPCGAELVGVEGAEPIREIMA
jgi:hypothetical protein